ncbi:class I SAM-dependent methyltransferase [Granulicella arctica]|uniref:class I SAM-dependent methyltransferase n=1 Tax=Granulicella arctica TaxID=940613 RepID=UPI0021E002E9|nr:class I SAM-dependent methyltransferase [Granulicella arctica]
MTVHAERFTGRVEEYERYRLRYSLAVLTLLRERCGLRERDVVADVGAGTGMLSELFLENGNAVVAVEPNAAMRVVCERLREKYPRLTVVDASAEVTSLGDASVDFVTAGRAFHWFDPALALPEFRRVLRSRGWLVLVANGRSVGDSEQALEYERILAEEDVDQKDVASRYKMHDVAAALFAEGSLIQEQLHGEQRLTLEEFLGQTQSYSSVPLPGDAKYEGMQRALREHFARWQREGVLTIRTTCLLTCGILGA